MSIRKITRSAVLIGLSAVGAMIKIPSPTGTVAFDSMPGYLAAAVFGWREGALVAALGHLFSALTVGFPLGLPMHLFIAVQMALYAAVFAVVLKKLGQGAAIFTGTLLNGVMAPALLIPILGMGAFMGLLVPLLVGSLVNITLAVLLYRVEIIRVQGLALESSTGEGKKD